ncbi:MAG: hypothetical protein KDK25_03435 [Leptospiraceae bacterium]|nr:hypothetical protein [Leptospiraceae bacterium]
MNELEAFLRAHREPLNQRFRIRWLEKRSISGKDFLNEYKQVAEAFLEALASLPSPVASAPGQEKQQEGPANQISAAQRESSLLELYDLLLDLQGHRLWNEEASLREIPELVFQSFPRLSAGHCGALLSRAINIGFNIQRFGIEPRRWWTLLKRFGPMDSEYSSDTGARNRFFRLMGAMGWLAGLSQFRLSAIAVLESMSEEEGRALFPSVKTSDSLKRWLGEMKQNPWAGLSEPSPLVLGGFRGFGYQFYNPPRIVGPDSSGGILLRDSRQTYLAFADRFGAQIVASPTEETIAPDQQNHSREESGGDADMDTAAIKKCIAAIKTAGLPLPEKFRSSRLYMNTGFLVSEDSHYLWVVPG